MEQLKIKRNRGVVLSASGLQRLTCAIHAVEAQENEGDRFTNEILSDRCGISSSTLIYRNHLQRLLAQVSATPQWIEAIRLLISDNASGLHPVLAYKLEGLGLIVPTAESWRFRCGLYRDFFTRVAQSVTSAAAW